MGRNLFFYTWVKFDNQLASKYAAIGEEPEEERPRYWKKLRQELESLERQSRLEVIEKEKAKKRAIAAGLKAAEKRAERSREGHVKSPSHSGAADPEEGIAAAAPVAAVTAHYAVPGRTIRK